MKEDTEELDLDIDVDVSEKVIDVHVYLINLIN